MRKSICIIILIFFTSLFVACSKKDGTGSSTSSYKVKGVISGNGYSSRLIESGNKDLWHRTSCLTSTSKPDKIVAMYNYGKSQKEFDINTDGSFEIDTNLFDNDDLVFFVVNSSTQTVFGNLNLTANDSETLDFIEKESLDNDLDLGNINSEDNCSTTTTVSSNTSFKSSELERMQKLSRNDDGTFLFINNWKNPQIESYVEIAFNMDNITNIVDTYSNQDNFSKSNNFDGINPLFYVKYNITDAYLYPPSTVKHNKFIATDNYTYTADNSTPMSNTPLSFNSSCSCTTVYMPDIKTFPSVDWVLKKEDNSTTIGTFSFIGAVPFDDQNYLKTFIPSIKIVTDGSSNLSSMKLKFYSQNKSGTIESAEPSTYNSVVNGINCSYVKTSGSTSANFTKNDTFDTDTEKTLTVSESLAISNLNKVICSYEIGQSKYSFYFNR